MPYRRTGNPNGRPPGSQKGRRASCHSDKKHYAKGLCRACYYREKQTGFTPEEYDQRKTKQAGICACCGKPPNYRALHADHDHKTGAKRGLLCKRCNNVLGMMEDDAKLLDAAAAYLREWKGLGCPELPDTP